MFYMEGNLFLFSLYNTHNVFWWDTLSAVTFLELISMSMSHTGGRRARDVFTDCTIISK